MTDLLRPRYPVFVPSKGRYASVGNSMTVGRLLSDGVPFRLVVEPAEARLYAERWPSAELLVTPHDEMRLLGVRNWIRDFSIDEGWDRHWQLDDNITDFRRYYRGYGLPVDVGVALRVCEDFTDRYTNIGVSGLSYRAFMGPWVSVPFWLNCHVYSTSLIWNRMPYRWRALYNDDTDLCLQVLAGGLCTVALNIFIANKALTMHVKGGNTDDLYRGDGRLRMARSLERQWPYVVETKRRFDRPQHVVRGAWHGFDTPLERRTDIDWAALEGVNEYGLQLEQVADTIRSPKVRSLVERYADTVG